MDPLHIDDAGKEYLFYPFLHQVKYMSMGNLDRETGLGYHTFNPLVDNLLVGLIREYHLKAQFPEETEKERKQLMVVHALGDTDLWRTFRQSRHLRKRSKKKPLPLGKEVRKLVLRLPVTAHLKTLTPAAVEQRTFSFHLKFLDLTPVGTPLTAK